MVRTMIGHVSDTTIALIVDCGTSLSAVFASVAGAIQTDVALSLRSSRDGAARSSYAIRYKVAKRLRRAHAQERPAPSL